MRPTNLNAFHLPTRRLERSVDALVGWIERHWSALLMCAVFVVWAGVMDADYQELAAADKRAAEDAQAQRDELSAWVSANRVRVSIEGDATRVRELAQQVAAVVK